MDARTTAVLLASTLLSCNEARGQPREPGVRPATQLMVVEKIYESGLARGWKDYGWAPRTLTDGPARLDLSSWGGWIVAHPGLKPDFGGLVFRFNAPEEYGDFLEVRLDAPSSAVFPRVKPGPADRRDLPGGWSEVFLPMAVLDPTGQPFDRVVLRTFRKVGGVPVLLEGLGFTREGERRAPALAQKGARPVSLGIDCGARGPRINPGIYGIAFDPRMDRKSSHQWQLGATARRWGGNASSRYNWELGNAWNTANDWFFRNVNYTGDAAWSYQRFFDDNLEHGVAAALTVPMLGWVAKDTASYSFPVSALGAQKESDPWSSDAGNGVSKTGKSLAPLPPSQTSARSTPESIARWVRAIRRQDQARGSRGVQEYILDNEPMLWNSTHRDVHPEAVGYDELLERTLSYAHEVRQADPQGLIAGPALWGWPAYFWSAKDMEAGVQLRPDRRAHGDVPLLEWYLRKLKEHEDATGERLLDVVDVHFYPQGKGLRSGDHGDTDEETNARRIRSTRALWDPTYVDESWIAEPVRLIPRLKEIIAAAYPGRGISIGEYSFGAESHMSGALALAEALGRFGTEGVTSAFYWTYPANDSPAFWAFRAYRDFDHQGGRFQDVSLSTRAEPGVSLFASTDEPGGRVVAVVLNLAPDSPAEARIDVASCGEVEERGDFTLSAEAPSLTASAKSRRSGGVLERTLPPYSLTVIDLKVAGRK